MKKYTYIIIILLLLLSLLFIFRQPALKSVVTHYFNKQFGVDVKVERLSLNVKKGLKAENVYISNPKGLRCKMDNAIIELIRTKDNAPPLIYLRNLMTGSELSFKFTLKDVDFSYSGSKVVNGIADILGIEPLDIFKFNNVEGEFHNRGKEHIVRSLKATGELIRLSADGTIQGNSSINYSFKISLSDQLTQNIPETIRQVFFKQSDRWSETELYISGDIDKPSIDFSTALFKLKVR